MKYVVKFQNGTDVIGEEDGFWYIDYNGQRWGVFEHEYRANRICHMLNCDWLFKLLDYMTSTQNEPFATVRMVHRFVEHLIDNREMGTCDAILSAINVDLLDENLSIAFLSATLKVKDQLPYRKELFKQLKRKVPDSILQGLE